MGGNARCTSAMQSCTRGWGTVCMFGLAAMLKRCEISRVIDLAPKKRSPCRVFKYNYGFGAARTSSAVLSFTVFCGSQYCSAEFQNLLKGYDLRFKTRRAAKDEVIDWLLWYVSHTTLHCKNPDALSCGYRAGRSNTRQQKFTNHRLPWVGVYRPTAFAPT